MSVSNISSSSNWISQLAQLNKAGHTHRSGSNDAVGSAKPAPAGGSFVDAIAQALSQIGIDTTMTGATAADNTSGTGTSTVAAAPVGTDPAQALSSFLQNLLAALQAQGNQATGNAHDNRDGDKGQGSSSAAIGKGGLPRQNMQADLQSLINKLSSASSSNAGSTDPAPNALQQSFQSLVEALGGSGGNTTLPGFLKALAHNAPGASLIGGVVSTLA